MNIKLTPNALTQLELVTGIYANETGFIMGGSIGKYMIIENLFPIDFNEDTIDEIYAKMYSKWGDKLIGVFFNNKEPFISDWFIGDIVIRIKYPQPEFYFYDADKRYIRLKEVTV